MTVQGHPCLNVTGFTNHIQVMNCPSENWESATKIKGMKGKGALVFSELRRGQNRRGQENAGKAEKPLEDGDGDAGLPPKAPGDRERKTSVCAQMCTLRLKDG